VQWVPGIYGLTYAGFTLLGGRAADLLGRRRIFLLGATLFGLASMGGGVAPNGWLLILARGVQGLGAALTMPAAGSIITTTFPEGPERNKALGIFSATGGAGFTCGLVLGGMVTHSLSWHWVFFINIPFILLILLLSPLVVPEGRNSSGARSYDLAGAITVTGGLLLLVYTITQTNDGAAPSLKTVGLLSLALFLLGAFLLIERQTKEPLMPLRIFRSSTLGAACVVSFTLLGSFFGFLFVSTLYLQNVLHFSPLDASFALLPASIACIPASQFLAPWFMNRLGIKLTTVLGMLCQLSGITLFLRTGEILDYVGTILPATLLILPLGMSLCVPTLAAAAASGVEPTEQGLAAGLQGTSGQAGGGLFLALTAAVVTISTASAQTSFSSVAAQLRGFHAGLLVVAAGAALGALVALVGIRSKPLIQVDGPEEERR
jgi:hypothetical protein